MKIKTLFLSLAMLFFCYIGVAQTTWTYNFAPDYSYPTYALKVGENSVIVSTISTDNQPENYGQVTLLDKDGKFVKQYKIPNSNYSLFPMYAMPVGTQGDVAVIGLGNSINGSEDVIFIIVLDKNLTLKSQNYYPQTGVSGNDYFRILPTKLASGNLLFNGTSYESLTLSYINFYFEITPDATFVRQGLINEPNFESIEAITTKHNGFGYWGFGTQRYDINDQFTVTSANPLFYNFETTSTSVIKISDGYYLLNFSPDGFNTLYRLDMQGNIVNEMDLGEIDSDILPAFLNNLVVDPVTENVTLLYTYNEEAYLKTVDKNLVIKSESTLPALPLTTFSLCTSSDGGFYVTGAGGENENGIVWKVNRLGGFTASNDISESKMSIRIIKNSGDQLTVSTEGGSKGVLKLLSIDGKQVGSQWLSNEHQLYHFDIHSFTPGLYVVQWVNEAGQSNSLKWIKW